MLLEQRPSLHLQLPISILLGKKSAQTIFFGRKNYGSRDISFKNLFGSKSYGSRDISFKNRTNLNFKHRSSIQIQTKMILKFRRKVFELKQLYKLWPLASAASPPRSAPDPHRPPWPMPAPPSVPPGNSNMTPLPRSRSH